jgi:hypothetical protein
MIYFKTWRTKVDNIYSTNIASTFGFFWCRT